MEVVKVKKKGVLNPQLAYLLASLGHTDEIVICDAGLPIPINVERIDLILKEGIPSFIDTVEYLLEHMVIEGITLANEIEEISPELNNKLLDKLPDDISVEKISHQEFKKRVGKTRAVIRTGECTPYANIILKAGVDF